MIKTQTILKLFALLFICSLLPLQASAFHSSKPETQQRSVTLTYTNNNQPNPCLNGTINTNTINVNQFQQLQLTINVQDSSSWASGVRVEGMNKTHVVPNNASTTISYQLDSDDFTLKFINNSQNCVSPFALLNVNVEPYTPSGTLQCLGMQQGGYYGVNYEFYHAHDATLRASDGKATYLGRATSDHSSSGEYPYYLTVDEPAKNIEFTLFADNKTEVSRVTCPVPAHNAAIGASSPPKTSVFDSQNNSPQANGELLRDEVDYPSDHTDSLAARAARRDTSQLPADFFKNEEQISLLPVLYFISIVGTPVLLYLWYHKRNA